MSDECKVFWFRGGYIQENGIIRDNGGLLIGRIEEWRDEIERLTAENELLILQAAHAENEGYDAAIAKIGQKDARNELLEKVLYDADVLIRARHNSIETNPDYEILEHAIAACDRSDALDKLAEMDAPYIGDENDL